MPYRTIIHNDLLATQQVNFNITLPQIQANYSAMGIRPKYTTVAYAVIEGCSGKGVQSEQSGHNGEGLQSFSRILPPQGGVSIEVT